MGGYLNDSLILLSLTFKMLTFLKFFSDLILALAVALIYLCIDSSSDISPAQIFPLNPELYVELPAPVPV